MSPSATLHTASKHHDQHPAENPGVHLGRKSRPVPVRARNHQSTQPPGLGTSVFERLQAQRKRTIASATPPEDHNAPPGPPTTPPLCRSPSPSIPVLRKKRRLKRSCSVEPEMKRVRFTRGSQDESLDDAMESDSSCTSPLPWNGGTESCNPPPCVPQTPSPQAAESGLHSSPPSATQTMAESPPPVPHPQPSQSTQYNPAFTPPDTNVSHQATGNSSPPTIYPFQPTTPKNGNPFDALKERRTPRSVPVQSDPHPMNESRKSLFPDAGSAYTPSQEPPLPQNAPVTEPDAEKVPKTQGAPEVEECLIDFSSEIEMHDDDHNTSGIPEPPHVPKGDVQEDDVHIEIPHLNDESPEAGKGDYVDPNPNVDAEPGPNMEYRAGTAGDSDDVGYDACQDDCKGEESSTRGAPTRDCRFDFDINMDGEDEDEEWGGIGEDIDDDNGNERGSRASEESGHERSAEGSCSDGFDEDGEDSLDEDSCDDGKGTLNSDHPDEEPDPVDITMDSVDESEDEDEDEGGTRGEESDGFDGHDEDSLDEDSRNDGDATSNSEHPDLEPDPVDIDMDSVDEGDDELEDSTRGEEEHPPELNSDIDMFGGDDSGPHNQGGPSSRDSRLPSDNETPFEFGMGNSGGGGGGEQGRWGRGRGTRGAEGRRGNGKGKGKGKEKEDGGAERHNYSSYEANDAEVDDDLLNSTIDEMMDGPEDAMPTRRDFAIFLFLLRRMSQARHDDPPNSSFSRRRNTSPTPGHHETRGVPRTSYDVRHNDAEHLRLKREVRILAAEILKLEESPIEVPTPLQIQVFTKSKKQIDGPDLGALKLNLANKSINNVWNKRASVLFAQRFITEPEFDCKDLKAISNAFMSHLKTLQALRDAEEQADLEYEMDIRARKVAKSRENRRRGTRTRRSEACIAYSKTDSTMKSFVPVWKKLSFLGMSGDESDHIDGNERYAYTNLPWRNPATEVKQWFKNFDYLHLSTRFTADDRATSGKFPHVRINSARVEQHASPVPSLPHNFYNPVWLATMDDFQLMELDIQPPIDLSFSQDML